MIESTWKNIQERTRHTGHAVYELQLTDQKGASVIINRFLDTDKDGILCIGQTKNMERRRKDFIAGKDRCQLHSEGKLLFLLEEYSEFKKKHKKPEYRYRFQRKQTETAAKKMEKKLVKDYVKQYGEVPPLNSAIPDRYDLASWDC